MAFIQARNYRRMGSRSIDLIVVHSMENDEKPNTAMNVARWFAASNAPMASAHACCDDQRTVNCVADKDIAYAAPGANHQGFHIELTGRARQGREEWLDDYSRGVLNQGAVEASRIAKAHKIPARYVSAGEVRNGARGVTTHNDITQAFRKSDHWDPGKGFPMDVFIGMMGTALGGMTTPSKLSTITKVPMEYIRFECPTGGYWLLETRTGGVGNYEGAPFFGSVPGVDPDGIESTAVHLCPFRRGDGSVGGYWVLLANGQIYGFGEALHKGNYDAAKWGNRTAVALSQTLAGYTIHAREAGDPAFVLDTYAL